MGQTVTEICRVVALYLPLVAIARKMAADPAGLYACRGCGAVEKIADQRRQQSGRALALSYRDLRHEFVRIVEEGLDNLGTVIRGSVDHPSA